MQRWRKQLPLVHGDSHECSAWDEGMHECTEPARLAYHSLCMHTDVPADVHPICWRRAIRLLHIMFKLGQKSFRLCRRERRQADRVLRPDGVVGGLRPSGHGDHRAARRRCVRAGGREGLDHQRADRGPGSRVCQGARGSGAACWGSRRRRAAGLRAVERRWRARGRAPCAGPTGGLCGGAVVQALKLVSRWN